MNVQTSSEQVWQRRVWYLTALVVLLQAGIAAWLGWQASQQLGLTLPEAQAVAYVDASAPFSAVACIRRMFVAAPLTEVVLRVAAEQVETLWQARGVFWLVSVMCLLMLVRSARAGSSSHLAMLWTAVLAGGCAQWWLRSHQVGPVIMATWGVLIAQWGWHYLRTTPRWYAVLIYAGAALAGIAATPYTACIVVIHALWWLGIALRRLRPVNDYGIPLPGSVAVAALHVSVVIAVLSIVFNKLFVFKAPTWFVNAVWWHDTGMNLWTTVSALAGSSYAALPFIPSQLVWQSHALAYGVTWALALLALLGCLRCWRRAAGAACIWGGMILLMPFVWTGLTGRYAGADRNLYIAVIWPFVLLLAADACAWLTTSALDILRRLPRPLIRRSSYAIVALSTVVVCLVWWHAQRTAHAVALYAAGDADLAAPAVLLNQCVQPADHLLLVSPSDPTHDARLRWYLAPLFQRAHNTTIATAVVERLIPHCMPTGGVLWLVNDHLDYLTLAPHGLTNITLRYAVALEYVCRTNDVQPGDVGRLYRRAVWATPLSLALRQQFMGWYTHTDDPTLRALIVAGQAQKDVAGTVVPPLSAPQRGAANAALYAWGRQYPQACAPELFPPLNAYVSAVGPAVLDCEHVLYLYRLHIEHALAQTNLVLAGTALRAARRWDDTNPYLDRLAAQMLLLEDATQVARAKRLNTRAARTFERRHHRPFVEALFANMVLDKQHNRTARALQGCTEVLHDVQKEAFIPLHVRTNTAPGGAVQHAEWQRQRLFWEAQCHAYLALLLLSTGDYNNAVAWLSRNLDPRFDDVRRAASYEQLARLYTESGDVTRALRHFESLAALATSTTARIHWLLQAAQLQVTAGDTVAAHELWQQVQELANQLNREARRALARNKQYQRLLRHVERRMNLDGRDAVILALQVRAQRTPQRAAWYYRQMAHIERTRLQYDNADAFFDRAMQAEPAGMDASLDAAVYYYRRLQYPRAASIVSNVLLRSSTEQRQNLLLHDWRYAVLAEFYARGVPTPETNAFAWCAAAATNFAEPAAYYNTRGNLYAFYDHFDAATNAFHIGIATNALWLDNYLDLGFLLCTHADSDTAGALLDTLDTLPGAAHRANQLYGDWRHVIMHHVSIRPYLTDKDVHED